MKTTKLNTLIISFLLLIFSSDLFAQSQITFNSQDSVNIFLLRGLTRESGHWGEEFTNSLKIEFPNAKITYLDLPGSGKYYKKRAGSTVNKLMRFMRKQELENIQATQGKNIIVASSLGAMVAAEWMEKHPEDFQALVMAAGSFRKICTLDERANPRIRKELFNVLFESDLPEREARVLRINSNDSRNFERNHREWVRLQKLRPMSKSNMFRQSIAGIRYSFSGNVPEVPVLVVGSRGDRMVSESCITKVNDAFGGTLAWHKTAGHGIPIDAPEWLVSTIKSWVNTNTSHPVVAQAELAAVDILELK